MKHFILSVLSLLIIGYSLATCKGAGGDELKGVWMDEEKNTKIEFFKDGDTCSGKIVWLANPTDSKGNPRLDINNPDPGKRDQPIIGLTIIQGLEYSGGSWEGKIYAPLRGRYANCKIQTVSEDQLQLTVSVAMFSQTKTWTRAK